MNSIQRHWKFCCISFDSVAKKKYMSKIRIINCFKIIVCFKVKQFPYHSILFYTYMFSFAPIQICAHLIVFNKYYLLSTKKRKWRSLSIHNNINAPLCVCVCIIHSVLIIHWKIGYILSIVLWMKLLLVYG